MGLLTCETVYGAMKGLIISCSDYCMLYIGLETFSQLVYHISNGGVCFILCY